VERLLSDAASANMNMVRVWGGGQYESEDFYRLCDEKGLLVWQDFMFSCATYPAEPWFLGRVSEEVRHQVKRLRHHPSLAIWCGNNENVGALGWFPESRENPLRYREDYERLNAVVRDIVRELDPGRPWWPSSPSAGPGDYTDNWHDDARGDMHYWSVWHEGRSFDAYYEVIPRFCSEFGFQSFPSLDAVRRFAPPDQWNVTSADMGHHQRSPRGNSVIIETMRRYFRRPEGFENLLYLSQVQQALAIRTAVEFWRSNRPRCMGSLYWQLNDVWPGASWSSIEHSGKWKLLHYAARRFFAAVHVAVHCADGETVRVVGLNDTSSRLPCRLVLRVIDFAGRTHLEEKAAVELGADASTQLRALPVQGLPLPPEAGFLQARLVPLQEPPAPESALPSGDAVPWGDAAPCSELFLVPYKRCELRQPMIDMQVDLESEEPVVALRSDAPAFFVALEPGDVQGVFEDNLFTLLPGEPRTIRFSPRGELRGPSARERLRAGLKLFHLRATYP
jgi:beta-mannosidase